VSIEDRIAEILRTHFWIEHLEGCACGEGHYRWDYGESHYIAHVARVLVTELGLQPDPASEHIAATRYVTPWENT